MIEHMIPIYKIKCREALLPDLYLTEASDVPSSFCNLSLLMSILMESWHLPRIATFFIPPVDLYIDLESDVLLYLNIIFLGPIITKPNYRLKCLVNYEC